MNPAPPVTRIFISVRCRRRSATSRYTSRVAAAVAPHVNWPARSSPRSRRRSLRRPGRLDDGPGDGRRILRVAQDRGAARGLRHGAGVRGHDRAAAGHGLEDGQPEGLVERRVHEHVGRPVEADGLLERDPADEDHVAARCRARPRASAARRAYFSSRRGRRSPAGDPRARRGPAPRPAAVRRSSCTATARTRTARTAW